MAVNFDGPPGSTPLDPDELEGLKPGHIIRRSELDEWEAENILKAETWLLRARRKEILTLEFIKLLHRQMYDRTWVWAKISHKRKKYRRRSCPHRRADAQSVR